MGYDEPKKPGVTHVYVRCFEPLKFMRDLRLAVEEAVSQGFTVNISLGGPEKFPTHKYQNKTGGILFFIYLMVYWTKMEIAVSGKSDNENSGKAGEIESAVGYQAEEHHAL